MLVALIGVVVFRQSEAQDDAWRGVAESALEAALRAAHPQVTSWNLEPIVGAKQGAVLEHSAAVQADVLKVGKRSALRLKWRNSNGKAAQATLWFAVSGMQSVIVASAALRAGAALESQSAMLAERDVMSLDCKAVIDLSALVGMRTRRTLHEGDAICASMIEPRPAVGRGEEVLVRSVAGPVTVVARGIAEQDGAVGQRLRVRNPDSRQIYIAAVSGEREVVVDE